MFGKRLKELRCSHNLSMDKLVELYNKKYDAKMNKSTLSRYENGMQDPIYTVVVNFADFFEVTVDYLSGHTPTLSADENHLLDNYRQLNDLGKERATEYIHGLLLNKMYTIGDKKTIINFNDKVKTVDSDDELKTAAYGGGVSPDDTIKHT